ncbi:scavenger receptor class F member 2-like [Ptychodera flava]|uniref:scavenger receptor class F member 2-like n=1 Tax=Ptychodera flava TaxID=63121 RepID=UPI003969F298
MISVTLLSALFIVQSFRFQMYASGAIRRNIGPVDRDAQHACPWYNTIKDEEVYRCCSGFYLEDRKCIACPRDSFGYRCARTCDCKSHEQCDPVYGCKCKPGKWGNKCEKSCSPSCNDMEECNQRNGKCRCPPGKWGKKCEHHCQCYTRAQCDRQTGTCQCETGWMGDTCTDCNESEVDDTGKRFCTDKCLHCFNGESCSITDPASCDCTPGWKGNKCNISIPLTCDSRFNRDMCRNHNDCDGFQGCNLKSCKCDECARGYRGEKCKLPCKRGTYGYGCENSCSDVCESGQCHHITGSCTPCPSGYHGENCVDECPAGHYGYNCLTKYTDSKSTTQQSKVTMQGRPEHPDLVTSNQSNTTKQIQDSESRIDGDPDDIEDHSPLIIGVCVFLVLLIIIIVVISVVCCRRRKKTVNIRNVYYENVDVAVERIDTLAMFVPPLNDYEMADVETRGTTILNNDDIQ